MRRLKSLLCVVTVAIALFALGPIQTARADYPQYHDADSCRRNWGCWFAGTTMDGYIAHCYSQGETDPLPGLYCVCNPEVYGDIYPCGWQIWN